MMVITGDSRSSDYGSHGSEQGLGTKERVLQSRNLI